MTEGRRLLLAALQATTRRELARRIGVSAMAVSRWASGERVPTRYRDRVALEREADVPIGAWDVAPHQPNEPPGYTSRVTFGSKGSPTCLA